MPKKKPIEAYGYVRVSGKAQVDGDGLRRQRREIEKYAKAQGYRVAAWYSDGGVSGTNDLDNRPALIELLAMVKANGTRVILIEKADRLARDVVVQEQLIDAFMKENVKIISAKDGDMSAPPDDASRVLIRQMFGVIAGYEKTVLVQKLKSARIAKKKRYGHCEGQKPYGYYADEVDGLNRIVRLSRKRKGHAKPTAGKIARQLHKEGVPTRHGGVWSTATVSSVLRGRLYKEATAKPRKGK